MLGVEHHKSNAYIEEYFNKKGCRVATNPPESTLSDSPTGHGHGGEFVATRKHLDSTPIDTNIYDTIATHTNVPCRFAACIMRLKGMTILLVAVYLWCREGLSDRNQNILKQIYLLQQIIRIPIVCYGDFNFSPDVLESSDWLRHLGMRIFCPAGNTTLNNAPSSLIDFVLFSNSIQDIFVSLEVDTKVSWSPHYGLLLKIIGNPLSVVGNVLCIPKPLPLTLFQTEWNKLDQSKQISLFNKAKQQASKRLSKQKLKTGVAILGSPSQVLANDPKFKGRTYADSVKVGEAMAHTALATELLVLIVACVPPKDRHQYIGRSQYPKFKTRSICRANCSQNIFVNNHVAYWCHLRGLLSQVQFNPVQELVDSIALLLPNIHLHVEFLSTESADLCLGVLSLATEDIIYYNCKVLLDICTSALCQCLHKVASLAATSWRKFVKEQLYKGGGILFRFISKEDKLFMRVDPSSSPNVFLSNQVEFWAKFWAVDSNQIQVLAALLDEFRQNTFHSCDITRFTVETLDKGLKGYTKGSLGGDLWHPSELKGIPPLAREEIASQIDFAFQSLAWPHQSIVSLNPCLGKPNGGCRTICKTPMLYRMALRGLKFEEPSWDKWERMFTQSYDKAKRGSSCLLTALAKGLRAEVGHWCKKVPLGVFNDIEKFFDSLDIEQLLHEAIQLEFPPDILTMALQQHLAPRIIQVSGYSSIPVEVSNGILQGCILSVLFTRLYLLRDLHALTTKHKDADVVVFVDDTSCDTVQDSLEESINIVIPFEEDFAEAMKRKKLKLSSKGAVVSNTVKRTRIAQRILLQSGIQYNVDDSARDIGLTYTAGAKRPKKIFCARRKNVKSRILKIKQIAKVSRMAKKLFTGAAYSAGTWGHQQCGFSPNQLVDLERDALACSGLPRGRCRTISLVIIYGVQGTPVARVIRETVTAWFQLLPNCLDELRDAWAIARRFLNSTPKSYNHIYGIMSNLICLIRSAKWQPYAIDRWIDPEGQHWVINAESSPNIVAAALIKAVLKSEMAEAAKHHDGKGIEEEINWEYTLRHTRSLRSNSSFYPLCCALETIQCGACWTNLRVSQIDPSFSNICTRCDANIVETSLHTFWECPANDTIDDSAVTSTKYLERAAIANSAEHPCFWLRGLLPESLLQLSDIPPPYEQPVITIHGPDAPCWGSGTYYGDGSGGPYSSHPTIRRCGTGLAVINIAGELSYGLSANLPGLIQTVPRSEYFALLCLVRLARESSVLLFVTDHLPLVKAYNKGRSFAVQTLNGDLFQEIFLHISGKSLQLTLKWVPSHLADTDVIPDPLPTGVLLSDVLGNKQADKLAKIAAQSYSVDLNSATRVLFYCTLTRRIQNRLATIICNLPNRPKVPKPPPQPGVKLDAAIQRSTHCCYENGSRLVCARCPSSFPLKNQSLCIKWLESDCPSIGADHDKPVPLAYDHIHVGKLDISFSHKLVTFRGIIYCTKCGSISQRGKLGKLSTLCAPPTSAGLKNLSNLWEGKPPVNVMHWPLGPISRPLPPRPQTFNQLMSDTVLTPTEQATVSNLACQYDRLLPPSEGTTLRSVGSVSDSD